MKINRFILLTVVVFFVGFFLEKIVTSFIPKGSWQNLFYEAFIIATPIFLIVTALRIFLKTRK